jgi:hypothetical protein
LVSRFIYIPSFLYFPLPLHPDQPQQRFLFQPLESGCATSLVEELK